MELLKKAFGIYETNCYILRTKIGEFIIDPGVDSATWVKENVKKPLAILNTHGHFDHIWCNAELKKALNIPIICPKEDAFMLESDCFNLGLNPQNADVLVENNEILYVCENGEILRKNTESSTNTINVEYMFFPGHTPGCSMIKIGDFVFSGDFIFLRSIGRSDFLHSNMQDMINSLQKFKHLKLDLALYPGHGENTTIKDEQKNVDSWLKALN